MIFEATYVLQHGPQICAAWLPASVHKYLYAALVCGENLPAGAAKQSFLDTGLIHIMVVSGAHLIFLEVLVARAPWWARISVLSAYCWLTGFGAPVMKALAHRVLAARFRRLGCSTLQIELIAVLAVLLVRPDWLFTRSLQMSWMCALALALPAWIRPRALDHSLKAYALLFLFSAAPVLSIAWNTLLAPFIGAILFPLSLMVLPLPFLVSVVDRVWDAFLWILALSPAVEASSWFFASTDLFWIPPLLHLFFLYREVRWRRAFAFSC